METLHYQDKDVVVPGDIIATGMGYLPSKGAYRDNDKVIATRVGLLSIEGKVLKVVPLTGGYSPRIGDRVIGQISDVLFSGWRVELFGPYSAVLGVKDATTEFLGRGANLSEIFALGDLVVCKIINVTSQKLVDIALKGPGLRKLKGGRLLKVNAAKIPRVIGKDGSMVSMIKQATGVNIVGRCELTSDMFQHVADAAAAARAQFYLVQAEHNMNSGSGDSGALFGGNDNPQVGLENIAGVTGGHLFHLAANGENVLARVLRETAAHYLVSFDVDPQDRNGASHRLDIKAVRTDVSLRARPMLPLARAEAGRNAAKIAPRDTLRDLKPYRDLPLRVSAFSSRNAGDDKMKIVATIEPLDPAAALTSVIAGLYDASGKLVAQWSSKPEDVTSQPVLAALVAPAGTYRLRAAASDGTGRVGAVDTPLAAELTTAGVLKLSSMVLGAPKADGGFAPKMEFSTEPAAIVYLELYGGRTNMQISAQVEVAESLNGPAIQTAQVQWGATSEPDKFNGLAQVPLAALAPGDYVVRAIVGVEGQPEGRVTRTLRKR